MITVAEIEAKLRDRVEELTRQLLPNCQRDGQLLRIGSIDGEQGQSMVINLSGELKGHWKDFAAGDAGDMLDLIQACARLPEKRDAVVWAKQWLGIEDSWQPGYRGPTPEERQRQAEAARERAEREQAAAAREREAKMRGARALYLRGVPIAGTPAEHYLRNRALTPGDGEGALWPGVLRYCPEVYCREVRVKVPAMLAAAYLADGTHAATHRTFLQLDDRRGWCKLDVTTPKKVLGAIGGAFIPVNKGASGKSMRAMPEGEAVYVTEGIEDALVIRMKKPEARIIAAYSLDNIGAVVLPPAARRLVVVADRDENPREQDKLERAIARQQARGLKVEIVMPPVGVKDFNDWLRQAQTRGAA